MTAGLRALVRGEVEHALRRLGLATADAVADLTTRMREVEEELRMVRDELARARQGGT